jgi:hypothetical protein
VAILKGPWALQHGPWTIKLCREREVSFLIGAGAWHYRDPRTFAVDKFTATPTPHCGRWQCATGQR